MTVSVSHLPNPYDFANPVSEERLFAGRRSELSDISYYIDLASKTERPINLALLGERASGKTSLLNMIEAMSRQKGMLPVRIDLDQSDVIHHFALFIKIFNSLLTRACEEGGAFGGLKGNTFQTYLEVVSTLDVPEDRTFCSFVFPIQYAKAGANGRLQETPVFDDFLKHDLRLVHDHLHKTCVLLFDECNVLRSSRELLEKLRNIFMNMPGFMLVFAGTPELFPVLDEVFSPISRQFKRIEVKAFQRIEETLECVSKPLVSLPIEGMEEVFDLDRFSLLHEIHRLTNGRPYEIQLVCHSMFRRVQEGRTKYMALDSGVLEDVRRDLVRAQSADRRALIEKVQALSDRDLLALGVLCGTGSPPLTVETAGQLEYLFHGSERIGFESLEVSASDLIKKGLIAKAEDECVHFTGDEFDFTYFKYLLKERGVGFMARRSVSMKYSADIELFAYLIELRGVYHSLGDVLIRRAENINDVASLINQLGDVDDDADLFKTYEREMRELFDIFFEKPEILRMTICVLQFEAEWWSGALAIYVYGDERHEDRIERLHVKLTAMQSRAQEVGVTVTVHECSFEIPDRDVILRKLRGSENSKLRTEIVDSEMMELRNAYVSGRKGRAGEHADVVSALAVELDAKDCNNIGYLRLAQNRRRQAWEMFDTGIARAEHRDREFGLLSYNRGVVRALEGDQTGALEDFRAAAEWAEGRATTEKSASCLFALRIENGQLTVEEVTRKPDIGELAAEATSVLQLSVDV